MLGLPQLIEKRYWGLPSNGGKPLGARSFAETLRVELRKRRFRRVAPQDRSSILKLLRDSLSMEVNDLGFVATILFVLVPTVFLLILYIQTNKVGGN